MIVQAVMEMLFDLAYFATALSIGIILAVKGKSVYLKLFGIMAIVLASGDAFHLVPRVYSLFTNGLETNAFALGLGQMITSITMTAFYVILYFIWELRSNKKSLPLRVTIFALAIIRIVLCLLPQNDWFVVDAPVFWGIMRNIPFAIIGIILIALCFVQWKQHNDKDYLFMAIAVILSFGFYIPVVLLANKIPLIGMLMIPKTLAYVWVVLIGYFEFRKEEKTALCGVKLESGDGQVAVENDKIVEDTKSKEIEK